MTVGATDGEIAAWYAGGCSLTEIAKITGRDMGVLSRIIRAHGVPMRRRGRPSREGADPRVDQIRVGLEQGQSFTEIGRALGITKQRAHAIWKRGNGAA